MNWQVSLSSIRRPFFDTPANYCVYALKFCMGGHDMPNDLEVNSNYGSKRGPVESYPLTTKTYLVASKLGRLVTYHEALKVT